MDLHSRLGKGTTRELNLIEKADVGGLVGDAGMLSGNIPPDTRNRKYLESAVGWVYACTSAIADDVASSRIRLYRQRGQEVVEVLNHPALDLIYRANDFTTQFDLMWMTSQYLELTGEAPWFLQYENGRPSQILLLRPDLLDVIPGKAGEILSGYKYRVGGKEVKLNLNELVFLRYPDPDRQFRGAGTLQAVARTVDIEDYSEEYNKRFFFNSARPDGALQTDQKLQKDQIERIEKKLRDKYRGVANAHKTLILQKGLKWQPMSLTAKDMDFIEQMRFSRDKILAIFRVPKAILGITEDVNRANAEAADYTFAKRTIQPKLVRIEQQLNEFLLPRFPASEGLFFQFDSPVPDDQTAKLEQQKAGMQYGYLTINEVRASAGYDGIGPEGDKVRPPQNNASVDGEPGENAAQDIFGKNIQAANSRDARKRQIRKLGKTLEKQIKKELLQRMKKGKKRRKKAARIAEQLAFHHKQLNIATDYQGKFQAKFKGIFQAQLETVLAKLPAKTKALNPDDFLLSSAKEKKRYIKELTALFKDLLVAQSAEAFAFVGQDRQFDPTDGAITRYFAVRAFRFANPVTRETNRQLRAALAEAINAGDSIPKIRKRVEQLFSDIEVYRSERIARSETIRASNYVTQEAWQESGVVTGKEWLTADDERTCPYCAPLDGKVVDLDADYFKRGTTLTGPDGRTLELNYEDVEHPPLHVNCRCTLVPVVVKSAPGKDEGFYSKLDKIVQDYVQE